ncbi:response regulator transcription factor [Anaeromicrobium sediminis]|uniref:Stage 0 sporulation protein A homolog n=1 Tax=Anaeromicrobium sediminis TaxID=1478221 RepID=A0A267MPW6_9FIRM|nr:response regulator transcription factor [Anaeromicrobium sediminis]PAB60823.1 DNA-binding response regulator [Anaeromicrobium sediminis]
MKILIAEDNRELCRVLKSYFMKEGYTVFTAFNGKEALDIFYSEEIDIVILDWMMPVLNGISVCKEIKSNSDVKVLILTAKSQADDELTALNIGADEYVRKPFDPRVLIARVNKLLSTNGWLTVKDVKLNMKKGKIFRDGEDINATNMELKLLHILLSNKGYIVSREQLLDKVWGYDYEGSHRTLDTHIRRLREKIGNGIIITHRGMGYSINAEKQ